MTVAVPWLLLAFSLGGLCVAAVACVVVMAGLSQRANHAGTWMPPKPPPPPPRQGEHP